MDKPVCYLVFGDLHGRVLAAFALAKRYQTDFQVELSGLLQVGDLGYFPDLTRLDSATRRHAARDPLELGVSELTASNRVANRFFAKLDAPLRLYFTAGNHEDHELLESHRRSRDPAWPVDDFHRVWCVDDGRVVNLNSGLKVGALWGIDGDAPKARRIRSPRVQIDLTAANRLCGETFDVLLMHESPRDAIWFDSGSEEISQIIQAAQPQVAFFGHYHEPGRLAECNFGRTQVFWMSGLEFHGRGHSAEPQSVGLLEYTAGACSFRYLSEEWLRDFCRGNWHHWLEV
jgi:hypothetical protein